MAEYKKKSVKKVKQESDPKPTKITMKSSSDKRPRASKKPVRREFKVIKGRKDYGKPAPLILVALAVVLVCAYFIILSINPIGVLETINSYYKKIGSGKGFDISLKGDNIINVSQQDNTFYILTETDILCVNSNGKTVSSVSHGFSKPIVKTSSTRALVYGQGGKHIKIYNYNDIKADLELENQILSADITDNGNFVIASYAQGYDSVVKVYNKKSEVIFEWYSADGVVSNVTLTPDGKKVYITTFSSSDGVINSKLSLYNLKSANAEKTVDFKDDLPFGVFVSDKNSVFTVFENKICHYNFKTGVQTVRESEYSNTKACFYNKKLAVVSSLSANADKNNIVLLDNKGIVKNECMVNFNIDDFVVFKDSYYILNVGNIYKTDLSGNVTHSAKVDADIERIIPVSDKIIATVKKYYVTKTELKENG